jgi:hypothetical protein
MVRRGRKKKGRPRQRISVLDWLSLLALVKEAVRIATDGGNANFGVFLNRLVFQYAGINPTDSTFDMNRIKTTYGPTAVLQLLKMGFKAIGANRVGVNVGRKRVGL